MVELKTTLNCKLCDKEILTASFGCKHCNNYSFNLSDDFVTVESETVMSGNFYFIYLPQYKQGHVINKTDENNVVLNKVELNELTPDLAKYWYSKIKKYVIFG